MLQRLLHGERLSEQAFREPARDLGILPFWFWNGDMRPEEMRRQMEELKAKGMPGFFIHGRFGLTVPYLSPEWFALVRQVLTWGKELDLQVWIYDEMNWPSGTAGWEVPRLYPDLAQRYLEMIVLDIAGPHFTFLEGTDARYIDMEDAEPVCAFAVDAREYETGVTRVIDLTPNLSFGKIVPWEAPPGDWKLLYFMERRARWYIDALNPEATRRFLEMTHAKYAERVGEYFGGVLPGFYTDEPACHYFEAGQNNRIIPWTKDMFRLFRQAKGYELRPLLPALFLPFGGQTGQIRYDFWHLVAEQYRHGYYEQIQDWCHQNGLLTTGHIMGEEHLRVHARCEGNIFHILKHFDVAGVDHLYPVIGTAQTPEQHVALKIASSAAHHNGSTRLLCESLGGTFWDVTMERMKWIADWEYVLGVNLFNPHGFHYAIEGERKRDWPPSQFYHHGWWEQYGLFQDYITRLSYLLSGGRHVAKVAVLYPMNAEWANYAPQSSGPISAAIEGDFAYLADALLRLHYDYDYLDEDTLASARTENGLIRVGDESYACLILPAATHILASTMERIDSFVSGGGTVIATTLPPETTVDSRENLSERTAALFGHPPAAIKEAFLAGLQSTRQYVRRHPGGGTALLLAGPGLGVTDSRLELGEILNTYVVPDVKISADHVFYLHRVKDGRSLYFFINPAMEESFFSVSLEGLIAPEIWDPGQGTTEPLWVYRHLNGRTEFELKLAARGSVLVAEGPAGRAHLETCNMIVEKVTANEVYGYVTASGEVFAAGHGLTGRRKVLEEPEMLVPAGPWRFRRQGRNALVWSDWRVKIADAEADYSSPEIDGAAWIPFTRGGWQAQVSGDAGDRPYPVILWYRTDFQADLIPDDLRLVVDGFKGQWQAFLNGIPLAETLPSAVDAMMRELPISGSARVGLNVLAIKIAVNDRSDGLLDLLKVMGSFALVQRGDRWVIAKESATSAGSADWTGFGYPYYSGTGIYETEIDIPRAMDGCKMIVRVECGDDLAEVEIDGRSIGIRPWHPYELDAGSALGSGWHLLSVKITNTMANLLCGTPKPSGLLGPVEIKAYARCSVPLGPAEEKPQQKPAG